MSGHRAPTDTEPLVLNDSTIAGPSPDLGESATPQVSLGQRTGRGFVWSIIQTITNKGSSLLGQVVLSYLLFPNDFGLVALAYTLLGFTALIQSIGVREILVRKQARIHRWQNTAFWLSLSLSATAMLVVILLAPLVARIYHQPDLTGIVRVMSLGMPLSMANVVLLAPAQVELRFKFLAAYGTVNAVAKIILQIIFALLGLGPYSIVLPHPVVEGACTLYLAWRLRPALRIAPEYRRWKFFLRDSVAIFLGNFCMTAAAQGVPFLLGLTQPPRIVGLYFWGYNLSLQTAQIIYVNLTAVLFPALTSVDDERHRQLSAFLVVTRLLALIAMPASFMQGLLADPAIRIVFSDRWHDAIPVVQMLSIGMGLSLVSFPSASLLQAQGRFWRQFVIVAVWSAAYLPLVAGLSRTEDLRTLAMGIMIFYCVASPLFVWAAAQPLGVTAWDVARLFGKPLLACVIAFAPAAWLATLLPPDPMLRIVIPGAFAALFYAATIRVIDPDSWSTVIARTRQMLGGRARPRSSPTAPR